MDHQERKDESLNRKAKKIAIRINNRLYDSQRNSIVIAPIFFKLKCGFNKDLERKVKGYIVTECRLKLKKKVYEYYFFGGICVFRKKRYIVKY